MTDDRGIYRLYGLAPGDYIVTATPRDATPAKIRAMTDGEIRAAMRRCTAARRQSGARRGRRRPGRRRGSGPPRLPRRRASTRRSATRRSTTPARPSPVGATTVTIGPGEERTGVDFQLQLVRTAKIEGTVVVPDGIPPQSVQLVMTPHRPERGRRVRSR